MLDGDHCEEIEAGKKYVLIGSGFGAYHAVTPRVFFGNLAPNRETGEDPAAILNH